MKVAILDESALKSIAPIALRGFVRSEGWTAGEKFGESGQVYWRGEPNPVEIILPVTSEIGDYAPLVSSLIRILSRELGRDELAIFRDLTQADRDVIRVRATEGEEDGSIGIDSGVDLISHARDMLAAAACSSTEPRRTYFVGKMQKTTKYMERVRLGQTEIGSFVVALLAPVPPSLNPDTQSSLWPDMETEPFERRVTRILSGALCAAKSALANANRVGGERVFESAVSAGVSANLCEAVAAISERGNGSEISVSWAKTRPTPEPFKKIRFTPDESVVLKEVAREFRSKEPRYDVTLSGYTPDLSRQESQVDGTVKLIGLIDGRPTSVSVFLTKEDYELAVEAHRLQLAISVTGDLIREGHRWRMVGPHNLAVLTSLTE